MKTAKEIVSWILENRHELDSIEIKGPLTVIKEDRFEIEKDLVAIANSAPESEGWLIFGINKNYEVIGTVDSEGNPLDQAEEELCSQRLSQIAASTRAPHVMYDWSGVDYGGKKLVVIRIIGRKRGHFYQTSKGAPPYRLDGHTYYADEAKLRSWIEEAEQEITEVSDPTKILALASIAIIFLAYSWFLTWVIGRAEYLLGVIVVFPIMILVVAYAKSWKIEQVASWSRKSYPVFLSSSICIMASALGLEYTLTSYPIVSGFVFQTYLENLPTYASYLTLATLGSGVLADLPSLSTRELIHVGRWFERRRNFVVGAVLVTLAVTFSLAGYSRIDSNLALTTPIVKLVESQYVTDGVVTISQNGSLTQYRARTINLITVHFLLPSNPLVSSVFFPLQSNSSGTPKVVDYQGISGASIVSDQSTSKMEGINIILSGTRDTSGFVTVSYFNEFNASKFVFISPISQVTLQNFGNGTEQVRETVKLANDSPYVLYFQSFPLSFGGVGSSPSNTTWIPTPDKLYYPGYQPPTIFYGDHYMALEGYLRPFANMTVIITYNMT